MPDPVPDSEFRHHVAVVAHMLAFRSHLIQHPEAKRGTAWKHAVENWETFLDRAVIFIVARGFREDMKGPYGERTK